MTGLVAEKTVEGFEDHARRPAVAGARRRDFVVGREMPLPEGRGRLSVMAEDLCDRLGFRRDQARTATIGLHAVQNGSDACGMGVSAGKERGARRRTNRGRVEAVVSRAGAPSGGVGVSKECPGTSSTERPTGPGWTSVRVGGTAPGSGWAVCAAPALAPFASIAFSAVAREVEARGVRAFAQALDLRSESSIEEFVAGVVGSLGAIETLFSNAAVAIPGALAEQSVEELVAVRREQGRRRIRGRWVAQRASRSAGASHRRAAWHRRNSFPCGL